SGGFAESAIEHLRRTLVVALIKLVKGFDHSARGVEQTLSPRIFADVAKQRFDRLLGFSARRTRLVCPDRNRQEVGGIKLSRTGFRGLRLGRLQVGRLQVGRSWVGWLGVRRLAVRRLAGAERFNQCVHFDSVRPALNRTGVSPADGAICRRTPEYCNLHQATEFVPVSARPKRAAGLYFRSSRPYIRPSPPPAKC